MTFVRLVYSNDAGIKANPWLLIFPHDGTEWIVN